MVVRLVRAGVGALLLLIAVPLALAGGGLWLAMEHRAADDTFTARLERVRSDGNAVVVPDVDALLRADAPFARGGQTTLNLSAVGSSGPLFIGLGPDSDVESYLAGLAQSRVARVRLARGPLPVELTHVPARPRDTASPLPPLPPPPGQPFWLAQSALSAGAARLTWSPAALRGRHLALVVMNADGTTGVDAAITARLAPAWLAPTSGGLAMLSSALFLLALLTLAWPQGRRADRPVLPTLPAQPTSAARNRAGGRSDDSDRDLTGPVNRLGALLNRPGSRDGTTLDAAAGTATGTATLTAVTPTVGTAMVDASPVDASPVDASTVDAAPMDAPTADAPTADASTADASTADAPTADARSADALTADASTALETAAAQVPIGEAAAARVPIAEAAAARPSTMDAAPGGRPTADPATGDQGGSGPAPTDPIALANVSLGPAAPAEPAALANVSSGPAAPADQAPDGDAPGGNAPGGQATDGGAPDGGVPDGGALDGGVPDGGAPDGGVPDGVGPDGRVPDGDTPDGGAAKKLPVAEDATDHAHADKTAVDSAALDKAPESELDRPTSAAGLPPLPEFPVIEIQFTWTPVALDDAAAPQR